MKGMGLKFTPVMGDVSYAIQACLDLWLALLGLITSPNSPNRTFNPPAPPPFNMPLQKKLLKIQRCKLTSRNSYKKLAERLFQLCSISGVATI